ncbi:hypothetical protein A9R05_04635 [Burkholderia sp. KK1]|nr:hypothetical protein A9R05_04635 [Burkholderia sp. KK1]
MPDGHVREKSQGGKSLKRIITGTIGFDIYTRSDEDGRAWQRSSTHVCSQKEFVALLETGRNSHLSLIRTADIVEQPNQMERQPDLFS